MKENFKPGNHPDADQLSIFAEGVASAQERERMLAHLTECAECRSVVFLMQRSMEPPINAAVTEKMHSRQRWYWPVGFAGAALAFGIALMAVYLLPGLQRPGRQTPLPQQESAKVDRPTFPLGGKVAAAPQKDKVAGPAGLRKRSTPGQISTHHTEVAVTGLGGASTGVMGGIFGKASGGVNTAKPSESQNDMKATFAAAPTVAIDATPQSGLVADKRRSALKAELKSTTEETLAGVSGHVSDRSGAVIPGATVALKDAKGQMLLATTSADGSFNIAEIQPGHYEMTVTARGFASYRQSVEINAREVARLEPVLNVGANAETVTVQASALTLETESATIDQVKIAELPSHQPNIATVSLGKRVVSMDADGTLFLSRNKGRRWKKIDPQWQGKVVRIESVTGENGAVPEKHRAKDSSPDRRPVQFQLTTDAGALWISEDGQHWRQK